MARRYIKIDTTVAGATQSGLLKNFVTQLRANYEVGVRIRAIMGNNNDGTNFTDVEALFGLPAGKGQTVVELITNAVGSMEGDLQSNDAKILGERMG
jgi:hypothetical protein